MALAHDDNALAGGAESWAEVYSISDTMVHSICTVFGWSCGERALDNIYTSIRPGGRACGSRHTDCCHHRVIWSRSRSCKGLWKASKNVPWARPQSWFKQNSSWWHRSSGHQNEVHVPKRPTR